MIEIRSDSGFDRRAKKVIYELNDLYEDAMSLRDDDEEKKPLIERIVNLYKEVVLEVIKRENILKHLN